LAAEPMKAYAERKAAREKAELEAKDKPDAKESPKESAGEKSADEEDGDEDEMEMEPGMMSGVGAAAADPKVAKKQLPVTILGRYAKVLMSSHEFLFVR
ncbi:MAG: hypothetical protein ABIW79_09165, partial [Gemmatimonas sp.]